MNWRHPKPGRQRSLLVFAVAAVLAVLPVSTAPPARAQGGLKVVVTIKPVHSLVAALMSGIGTPHLLVKGAGTPYGYALRPSAVRALSNADVVIAVSPRLELFLGRIRRRLPATVSVTMLDDIKGLTRHKVRTGGTFDAHDHGAAPAADGAKVDAHIWLDPHNAKLIVTHIERILSRINPAAAPLLRANAKALLARLDALSANLAVTLEPLAGKPYVVFHDAYQYLERRYALAPIGSVTVAPGQPPGARRIAMLRAKIKASGASCVFTEPQFPPKLVRAITEGTGAEGTGAEGTSARTAALDPVGAALIPGPQLYFTLMRNLAADLTSCLAE